MEAQPRTNPFLFGMNLALAVGAAQGTATNFLHVLSTAIGHRALVELLVQAMRVATHAIRSSASNRSTARLLHTLLENSLERGRTGLEHVINLDNNGGIDGAAFVLAIMVVARLNFLKDLVLSVHLDSALGKLGCVFVWV